MKVAFFIFNIDGAGGTERSVITQANALAAEGQQVTIVSVVRSGGLPHYDIDGAVRIIGLVDRADPGRPRVIEHVVRGGLASQLTKLPSLLVPPQWDVQFSALTDAACEHVLPTLDVDVVVSVTPGLLAIASQLLPARTALVHQEHRSSADRTAGMEPLLTFAPRADVVALLTPSMCDWLREALGPTRPTLIVMPNPLPIGFKPRSTLDTRLIVTGGRLVTEKQFPRLVHAFGAIADRIPDWRLRILGAGPQRLAIIRATRKRGLFDRVELPGKSSDMPSEWAMASVCALSSRTEGLPLVVQEAMAAGVPVVAYDAPSGARALVQHDVNGLLVAPDSVEGLASALLRVTTDDDLRHRLGDAALQSSRQYDADVIARRWIEVFEAAIKRRSRQPSRLLRRVSEMATAEPAVAEMPAAATDTTPAEARTIALRWAVECAARATSRWFVIPTHGTDAVTVVIPMVDRSSFLTELGAPGGPELLSLVDTAGHGWPERRGTMPELSRAMLGERTARISLEPWPLIDGMPGVLSTGCRVDIEFWESAPDGTLVTFEPNAYTSRVPLDIETVDTDVEGVKVRTLPLMTVPTVRDCTFPVDAVYTWVDGNDPAWQDARAARLAAVTGTALKRESSGHARFASRDELRYSLRSLHLFAPWVRKIHLVTAGQVPDWFIDHPKIQVVDHREILPPDALPTFNSHAIESRLHKVPELAEHFLYLNDDFLLGRPLPPHIFFTPSGQTMVFLSDHNLGVDDLADVPPWLSAARNNRALLRKTFGVINTHSLSHAPYAHRKSVLEEIEKRFPEELALTARSPFRSDDNISLLSSFAQHYGLITGTAVSSRAEMAYIDISAADVVRRLRRLQDREQDFICLGDSHEHALRPDVLHQTLEQFYDFYFPVVAPWEKPA